MKSLLAVALLCGAVPASAEERVLNIYNWSNLIGETTIADFTKATGIKVHYDTYDSDETLEAKLMAGSSGYDIVVPSATFLTRDVKAKVLLELDRGKIPNWANLDPALLKLMESADPGNKHAIVYDWGTTGLGLNTGAVAKRLPGDPQDSYDLLLDPKKAAQLKDCGITLIDSPADVFPIVLHYLGLPSDSQDPADLDKALNALMAIRPYVKYVQSGSYLNDLATGDVCLSLGWSGDVSIAQRRAEEAKNGQQVRYLLPKEGSLTWFGAMAVPADAPHPAEALAFINFVLDAKIAANFTNTVGYGNAVPASLAFTHPEIASDPAIYPTEADRKRLFPSSDVSPDYDRLRTRAWTTFKSGI
jgi:spermidine/putrescine-binding protein